METSTESELSDILSSINDTISGYDEAKHPIILTIGDETIRIEKLAKQLEREKDCDE